MEVELSLHDYWRIIKKRQWVGLMIFTATFLSTVFYTHLQIPLYRAQALVKFEPPAARSMSTGMAFDPTAAMQTQIQLLSSSDIYARVAQRMRLTPDTLPGAVSAVPGDTGGMISITVTGPDRLGAADLANAFVDTYVEKDLEERTRATKATLADIDARRTAVEKQLHDLEEGKKEFMRQNPFLGSRGSLAGTLSELEARRRELGKKFTAEHPDIIKLEQKIQQTKAQLSQAPAQDMEFEHISRDIRINEESYITLTKEYEGAKLELASAVSWVTIISAATAPTAPYFPNKRVNYLVGGMMGAFLAVLMAFILENLDISISTIEEIEKLLEVPVLGMIPHFGNDTRWAEVSAALMRKQRYPMEIFRSQMVFQCRPHSPTIEVYHSLRANIQNKLPGKQTMVIAVTSAGVAEGKSLTSLNFCLAAAQAGLRTLFIETDVRQPVTHKIFGLPKAPGLIEVLSGKLPWQEVIHETSDFLMGGYDSDKLIAFAGIDNFKLMTGWAASGSDVVQILSSPAVPKLIAEVRPQFDVVLFDCPPALLFVDALLVGAKTDGVVMVYKAGKMARRALKRAKDQIAQAHCNILGVVLNDMRSSDMAPRYGYYYDYGHYAQSDEKKSA